MTSCLPGAIVVPNSGMLTDESLSVLDRLWLTSDGTVVRFLEAWSGEPMSAVKLEAPHEYDAPPSRKLAVADGDRLLVRRVLLRGRRSGRNYLHATTVVAVDRIPDALHREMVVTDVPIGILLDEQRVETWKELLEVSHEPAGSRAGYFGVARDAVMLTRTYRVFVERRPAMVITETIPSTLFS